MTVNATGLDMNTHKILGVVDPTLDQDAATKKYVDDNSTSPGGADTQIQFNDIGSFGGDAKLKFDGNDLIHGTTDGDQILAYQGTGSAPGMSFQASPNTGFRYRTTNGHLYMYRAGVLMAGLSSKGFEIHFTGASGNAPELFHFQDDNTGISWDFNTGDKMSLVANSQLFVTIYENTGGQHEVIINEDAVDIDFRVESDTNQNIFFVEGEGTGKVGINTATPDAKLQVVGDTKFGDDNTNYVTTDATGDMVFVGGAGLPFAEIYARDNTATTSTSTTKTQVLIFDTNGEFNNMTPDHAQDHITVTKAGKYKIDTSISIKNSSGSAHVISVASVVT